jgi:hypothetical protein
MTDFDSHVLIGCVGQKYYLYKQSQIKKNFELPNKNIYFFNNLYV